VTLSDVAIQRPILTWMMTLALVVFGVLGFSRLGVDQFPNMEFPVLTVQAHLEGATPEGMEEDVTDVLEEHFNTIAGVRSLRSTSYQGISQIVVEFNLGTDLNVAAQEVRDKVALARVQLPPALDPPVVSTFNPNDTPVLWIPIDSERSVVETSEAIRRQIKPFLETIPGVAGVAMFGRLDRNIRIWLDGDQLRARGLSAGDVLAALQREHVEMPGGAVEGARVDYSVKTDAEFRTVAELETLVVAHQNGADVLLRDVARVEDGAEDPSTISRYNGKPAIGMGIRKQSGGNTVAIVDEVRARLGEIAKVLPSGMKLFDASGYIDFSKGVREAVAESEFALAFGALLAVFTVFVFLRRSRPTFIIALAIPVSLIATFGLVYVAGFTLNTMTLLGMALAVGVVIDDAIVVLENIERHREGGKSAREAAAGGTREIAFAATAATFSVAAVFVPVLFVQGLVGSFLRDFGLTVAGAVMISLFVALTLTPMLAARMPPPSERRHGSVYHWLEVGFEKLEASYKRMLYWTLDHRLATVGIALAAMAVALLLASQLKTEFFPPADEGIFFARLEAPPGTSLDATLDYLKRDERWFLDQPELAGLFSAAGNGGGGNEGSRVTEANRGLLFGTLKSRDQRTRSVMELVGTARSALQQVPGRELRIYNPSEMMTTGAGGGSFEVELRGNLALDELDRLGNEFMRRLDALGGFVDLNSSLKLGLPEVRIVPDREKAAALGVDARSVAQAIQVMVGGSKVGVFKDAGRRYDIRARLEEKDRRDPAAIGQLYVRTAAGGVVELRNLVRIETGAAASAITRTDRQRSVTISSNLSGGRTLGQAIEDARRVAKEMLPAGVRFAPVGQAQAMQEGARQFGLALGLGILVIYMVLAAQFESLVHPLTVMLALPFAMTGALGGLWITSFFRSGMTLNLFSMIGILLLFGLVTKNSILLVDYANQLRARGMDKLEAMRTAAPIRMRPVLMTAIAMIFGVLPAAFGLGPGAETRAPMAVASAAGMFSSMLLTLVVVPVFYLLFDDAAEWVKGGFRRAFGSRPAPRGEPVREAEPVAGLAGQSKATS
jgi:hydrophobe/amphiphile efflux-1 (HAE1) family protein